MTNTEPDHYEEAGERRARGEGVEPSFAEGWIRELDARYEAGRDGWWAS